MIEVPLTQGKVALIDDEDAERVLGRNWAYLSVQNGPGPGYAISSSGLMHRLILNAPRGVEVDHVNGDGLDNRRENLRLATHAQNASNSRLHRDNVTGYKGVRHKRNRWQARITVNQKEIYLGSFIALEDAARAYDAAAREHFGEFATPNFPPD
jgi:hypothetical protein